MKLVIFEAANYRDFLPIAHLRPTFELRCGHRLFYEKYMRNHPGLIPVFFLRDYLADSFAERAPEGALINDLGSLDDDLILINGTLLIGDRRFGPGERDVLALSERDEVLYAFVRKETIHTLDRSGFEAFLDSLSSRLPKISEPDLVLIRRQWELIHYNPRGIENDFTLKGGSGVHGSIHESAVVYGPEGRLYVGPEAVVHPQVVIDTHNGSVYIDQRAQVFPHSRLAGPCYIGPGTHITRGNIREGCSFGPACRVGGEVEESIIHGYSNKYHDGFLGHAYVGEWVNLGAFTSNSDLKNDYGTVEMFMQDKAGDWGYVDTGETKVGCFIGDHTKTSIGTLLNTGSHVGTMTLLMGDGKVLPKFIPSFSWYLEGAITGGFGYGNLVETARKVTARRERSLSAADRALLDHVYALTAPERRKAIKRDRKKLLGR